MIDPPAQAAPPPARAACQRWLVWAVVAGVLAHALFLSISVAGMQIGLAVALGAMVALRLGGRRVWARSELDLPCLVLAGAAVLSLGLGALAGSPPVGWHEATLWRSLLSPLVVLSALEVGRGAFGGEEGGENRLAYVALGVWAAASFVPSGVAWAQYVSGFDPLHALGLRQTAVSATVPIYPDRHAAVGFFRWYQRLAHNLTPPLCVAASLVFSGGRPRRERLLLAAASLAAAAAVVLTLSRLAWAGLVLGALILALLAERARRWAVPLVLVGSLAMLLHPGVRARIRHIDDPGINDDRKAIWGVCREMVAAHPLTGVGWGNLPLRSRPLYDRLALTYPARLPRAWCHNSFFSAWAEGGPLLCAAVAAYWALLLRAFWRWRRRAAGAGARAAATGGLAAVVVMFVSSLGHDLLYSSEATFGLGFAVAVAAAMARGGGAGGPVLEGGPPARPPGSAGSR